MTLESPHVVIERHRVELVALEAEDEFFAEVARIPPLADSDARCWENPSAWEDAYRLLAASEIIGDRRWRAGVRLIFERAAQGDLFGTMQSLRHGAERAFADDLEAFADVLEDLVQHPRAGTRQWAVRELGILRLLRSLPIVVRATSDPERDVREGALLSLQMLAQIHPAAEHRWQAQTTHAEGASPKRLIHELDQY